MSDLVTTTPSLNDLKTNSKSAEEKKDSILKVFQYDLEKHRTREVLDIFQRAIIPDARKNGSYIIWDVVPIVCQRLRGLSQFRFKTYNLCEKILLDLCEICNPKELLIIYLSELETDINIAKENLTDFSGIVESNCFKALLKPLENILLKLPTKRNETLKNILVSLNEHIYMGITINLDLTDYQAFCETTNTINNILSNYVNFLEAFVKEVNIYNSHNQICSKTSDPTIQRALLLRTLFSLLDSPIKYMELFPTKETDKNEKKLSNGEVVPVKPDLSNLFKGKIITTGMIATKIVRLISCLHANYYTLLNRYDLINEKKENTLCLIDLYMSTEQFKYATAYLSFFLITQPELCPSNFIPRVYTHAYNFSIHLPHLKTLLINDQYVSYKGLSLLEALLNHINEESLSESITPIISIVKCLVELIYHSSVLSTKQTALAQFQRLVKCMEPLSRYKLFYSIFSELEDKFQFQGLVVGMYKNIVFSHSVYQGNNLHRIMRTLISAISLPPKEPYDLIDKNILLSHLLNFIYYLLKSDQDNNTRIWDILPVIKDTFLKPLKAAIEESINNLKLELCKLKEMKLKLMKIERKSGNNKSNKKSCKKPANCDALQNKTTIENEHDQILMALTNFDVLIMTMKMIQEEIDNNQKKQPQEK